MRLLNNLTKQFLIIGLGVVPLLLGSLPVAQAFNAPQAKHVSLCLRDKPGTTVDMVIIPPQLAKTLIIDVLPDGQLATPAQRAKQLPDALAVINGGYFDPSNTLTTSWIAQHGKVVADPTLNPHLQNNPALSQFLPAINNQRTELRKYACAQAPTVRFNIVPHNAPLMAGCTLDSSLGAGPQLLPTFTPEIEAFTYTLNGKRVRDPLGVATPNARSAVGLTPLGEILLLLVGGKGLTLAEVAECLQQQGATQAMALDGGSSSALTWAGQTIWAKRNSKGDLVKRPVKSFLVLQALPSKSCKH
jgi:hypothetical protein